jgi:spore germination protein PE
MTTAERTSVVGDVYIRQVDSASVAMFGDQQDANLHSRALALQRAIPVFNGDELRYASYRIFTLPLPSLPAEPDVLTVDNTHAHCIRVGSFQSVLVGASSLIRIGCGRSVAAESRIKHIRQDNRPTRLMEPEIRL